MGTFKKLERVPSWRALAVHSWGPPADPTVYGELTIDMDPALAYLEKLRRETGERVTVTHLVGKAIAMAIAARPETNAIIRRGRIWVRDSVDVFFQVAFDDGENLAGAKVDRVDAKSVVEIARELRERAERIRTRKDHETQKSAATISKLPPWLAKRALALGAWLTYEWGLDLTAFGLPWDGFGSCMVTNVGGFGLEIGWAPLLPFARVPLLLCVGAIREAPLARDGRVVVARQMTIGCTFDHRLLDGYQAGKMAALFRAVLEDPERALA